VGLLRKFTTKEVFSLRSFFCKWRLPLWYAIRSRVGTLRIWCN
jgi:hypothetical protein